MSIIIKDNSNVLDSRWHVMKKHSIIVKKDNYY